MLATMGEAHSEWHRNAGVPMGQPGCPQDACDPYPEDDEPGAWGPTPEQEEGWDAREEWIASEPPF